MASAAIDYDLVKGTIQAAFLIIAYYIKRDLREIKDDGKANRIMNETNAANMQEHKAVAAERLRICDERHHKLDEEVGHLRKRSGTDRRTPE